MAAVEPRERRPGWLAAGAEATAGPWLTGVRQRPAARPARTRPLMARSYAESERCSMADVTCRARCIRRAQHN